MGQILDFIEIGTSDYNTILESCSDNQKGISIEPLKFYLDNLPDRSNVTKINAALVSDNTINSVKTYFIAPEDIKKHNLKWWIKGCNSVDKPHDFHINYPLNDDDFQKWHWGDRTKIQTRNLLKEKLVKTLEIPCFSYNNLMNQYDIDYVDLIKLDTEGQDASLLNSILDYYQNSTKNFPNTILFETNGHNKLQDSFQIIERLITIGYKVLTGEESTNNFTEFDYNYISHDCKAILIKNPQMENNTRTQYIQKYLTNDIRLLNQEDNDKDWLNIHPNPFEIVGNKEFSSCNQASLTEEFTKVKDQTKVIVEIGVSRISYNQTYDQTLTSVFLKHKNAETIYLGIDVNDKTSLQGLGRNIFTLQSKSEYYERVKAKLDALKISQIDFLFIDGWHSINQVIDELWYVDFMKSGGVIGFHDTNYHPGPSRIIKNLNPSIFEVVQSCEQQNDWGIGFAKLK